MNRKWHAAHVLPRNANDRTRLRWHLEHQKQCACRPIPAALTGLAKSAKRGGAVKPGRKNAGKSAARVTRRGTAVPARRSHPPPARGVGKPKAAGELFAGVPGAAIRRRCGWAEGGDSLYAQYHDEEWGRPSRDDRHLFEMLILEGAQAGLSWITILRKRENYRRAFDGFDPRKMAAYDARRIKKLLGDEGIVRNRLKIASAVANAKAFLITQKEFGSFSRFLWDFVGGKPLVNRPTSLADVPAHTDVSDAMSKALQKRGFKFVGSTICYAFMQATGLVNDHVTGCFLATR
jgi:DNA-3-methyladenine glycosylase I